MILALAFFLGDISRTSTSNFYVIFLSRAVEELNKIIELSRSEKETWCTINECFLNVVHEYIAHRGTFILEVEVSWEHS